MKSKVVFIGEVDVGKTSIIKRQTENTFSDKKCSTLGYVLFQDSHSQVSLQIWDLAGQDQYKCVAPISFRNADVFVLVFDCSLPNSFHALSNWYELIQKYSSPHPILYVVGNKKDKLIEINQRLWEEYATSIGAYFWLTSAKTGLGINDLFSDIADKAASSCHPFINDFDISIEDEDDNKCC